MTEICSLNYGCILFHYLTAALAGFTVDFHMMINNDAEILLQLSFEERLILSLSMSSKPAPTHTVN